MGMDTNNTDVQFNFRCGAGLQQKIAVWKRRNGKRFVELACLAVKEALLLYVNGKLRLHCPPSGRGFFRRGYSSEQITLPKRMYEALGDAAQANGISRGQLVRISLELYLSHNQGLFRYSRFYRRKPQEQVRCLSREAGEEGRIIEWPVKKMGLSL